MTFGVTYGVMFIDFKTIIKVIAIIAIVLVFKVRMGHFSSKKGGVQFVITLLFISFMIILTSFMISDLWEDRSVYHQHPDIALKTEHGGFFLSGTSMDSMMKLVFTTMFGLLFIILIISFMIACLYRY